MIEGICSKLASLSERTWARYAYGREPVRGKIPFEEYFTGFYRKAVQEGRQVAARYRGLSPEDLADQLEVSIRYLKLEAGAAAYHFAIFNEPDEIEICETVALEAQQIIDTVEDGRYRFHIMDVLLAHELFHAIQCREPELFINQKHLRLWKILSFENHSSLVSLGEVAAMAFAEELMGLEISPYVLDVVLCMSRAPEKAKSIYRSLLAFEEEEAAYG